MHRECNEENAVSGSASREQKGARREAMADVNNPNVQKILHSKQFAHVATIRPDGSPQSSPMWFVWDGAYIQFTPATNRQKYRNIRRDPRIAVSITAVDDPYTYAEFRGVVERIEEDP